MVLICLILLFLLPLTQIETYINPYLFHDNGLTIAVDLYDGGRSWVSYRDAIGVLVAETGADSYYPLIWLRIANLTEGAPEFNGQMVDVYPNGGSIEYLQALRYSEYATVLRTSTSDLEFLAVYSVRKAVVLESVINLARTLFVIIVLTIGLLYFNAITTRFVLNPIERMLEKVRLIATNPLAAATDNIEMAGALTMMAKMEIVKGQKHKELETQVLEQAITKIGHLLAVGFGDAGTTIISKNMNTQGDLNPMTAGVKTYAIFGFCDIHHFAETTEILQEDIMTFVNQIAEITHSQTTKNGGSSNKNLGEAFLLVWKYKNPDEFKNVEGKEIKDLKINWNLPLPTWKISMPGFISA